MSAAMRRASSRVRIGSPSQRHDPIRIVGPTVTIAWSPMRLPAAASSVSVGDFIGEDIFVSLVDLGGEMGAVVHGDYPFHL